MVRLRRLLLIHPRFAAALVALALALRLLVPPGYMIGDARGAVTVTLCPGAAAMTMPGMDHHHDGKAGDRAAMPCAFAGLAAPALAGADPVLLVASAMRPVAAVFRRPARRRPAATPPHLRPPLRGPPARA